jgi:hypothetical protein
MPNSQTARGGEGCVIEDTFFRLSIQIKRKRIDAGLQKMHDDDVEAEISSVGAVAASKRRR